MTRKFLLYFFLPLLSCNSDVKNQLELNYFHFSNYLFETDSTNIHLRKENWEKELGTFSPLFDYHIMHKANEKEDRYQKQILDFISNPIFREVNDSINKEFQDLSILEKKINDAFNVYNSYFPKDTLPKVITMFSGFNYGVLTHDTILAIGLEWFLGKDSRFYFGLNNPEYMRFQKQRRFILPSCMEVWCNHEFGHYDDGNSLLSRMLYKGKIMYFIHKMLPNFSMKDKLRFSEQQLKWCYDNEYSTWAYLIENNLLFSTQESKFRSYLTPAPFAKGMPKGSPGRIGYFIGYNIINSYMNQNPQLTIEDLMRQKNEDLILKESKYKPVK